MLDSTREVVEKPQRRIGAGLLRERVLDVRHYTDRLFSFTTTRTQSFRFESGHFTMIGLEVEGRPLLRAYSITSAPYDDHLEFFSIKVPNGPLTSRLQGIKPGDEIFVSPKPTGTLLLGNVRPGRRLILLATGTGFAPFASILRDPETYERFETVIATEGCRLTAELGFSQDVVEGLKTHELLGDLVAGKLHYYGTVTREAHARQGRLTDLIESGKLFDDLALPHLDAATDRVMLCGSPQMLADFTRMFEARGFIEGSNNSPGDFVIEKAFVER